MKIYYASQSFYPYIGGVSTYLLNLAREMVRRGNEVVEVHLRPKGETSEDEVKGIEVIRVPKEPIDTELMIGYSKFKEIVYKECHYNEFVFNKPPAEMEGYAEFAKVNEFFGEEVKELIESKPAEVVHIHDFQLIYLYKYVPRGTPLFLTWHIPFADRISPHLKEYLINIMKEYDKVVFSSPEYIKAAVKAGLPKEKTELIHPICNTQHFKKVEGSKELLRKKYNLPKDAKIILCVQRIDPKSGHEQLVKSLPAIIKKVPNAKLVFVGAESLSNKLSKDREMLRQNIIKLIDKLKVKDNIIFTGNIDYGEIPEIYNCADVATLVSQNEGFGLSVTEAMACGVPVIGTKVGGIPLQVVDGKNGYLVSVGDYKKTSERIIKILSDDDLRQKMSKEALKTVAQKFDMSIGIDKHLVMYNKVMREKYEHHRLALLNSDDFNAIITDFDGTLTGEEGELDKSLMKEISTLGKDLILATGRNIYFVRELWKQFSGWRCIVCENGSVIYFPDKEKTITISSSDMTKARKILKAEPVAKNIGKVVVDLSVKDFKKIKKDLKGLKLSFKTNEGNVSILPENVDKGLGLKMALQYMNINPEKTIIIGNGENDVDMFNIPGFKVALRNSHTMLKNLADQVVDKPSNEGVREVMKRLKN